MNRLLGALLLTSLFSNVQAEQLTLGVEDAIDHAVQSNLRTRLAQEKIKEIEAEVEAEVKLKRNGWKRGGWKLKKGGLEMSIC